jgi:hypothetical protein
VGLNLNGIRTSAYPDDVNLLGDNTDTIEKKKGTETLIHASKVVGLEINVV